MSSAFFWFVYFTLDDVIESKLNFSENGFTDTNLPIDLFLLNSPYFPVFEGRVHHMKLWDHLLNSEKLDLRLTNYFS